LGSGFLRDDRYVVAENPLLRSWHSVPALLTTGYWEGPMGAEAPVQEYRPVLMLTYFLTARTFGLAPWAFRAGNLLLHAANAALVFLLLRRRLAPAVALAAAALFAVLPIHVEAVAYIAGRSELLVTCFLLLAWLELDRARPRQGLACVWYLGALCSKEQAVLFPIVLLLDDWARKREDESAKLARRYLPLLACIAVYLAARAVVLSRSFHGGFDYFRGASTLVRALTMARFSWAHYAWTSLTGLGLQSEFVRPFFRDSTPSDPLGWSAAAAWLLLGTAAATALWRKRAAWGFWMISGFLWLLPVSNLILPLDTIGAERFLYLPSIGLCTMLAALLAAPLRSIRTYAAVAGLFVLWYAALTFARNRVWSSPFRYYETAVRDNPRSARAQTGLGAALIERGDGAAAEAAFDKALDLDADNLLAYYNLGRLRLDRGDLPASERYLRETLRRSPASVDSWILLGVVEERRGRAAAAIGDFRKAIDLQPWNYTARFNLGRLYATQERLREARAEFEAFLRLAPDDPQAPWVRSWLVQQGALQVH